MNGYKNFTSSNSKPLFEEIIYAGGKKDFSQIVSTKQDNSDERRNIGELATALTMISFGWFTHYPTQNKSNQGLDGAFLDPTNTFLFLTESKCRDEKCTAENYLKKEMDEKSILSKINREGVPIETTNFITQFLKETPQNIYKAVHRIKPNGKSQWAIEKLNYEEHIYQTLSPESPQEDIVTLFKYFLKKTNTSPEKSLPLVLKAFNLTPEDAIELLQKESKENTTPILGNKSQKTEKVQSHSSNLLPKRLTDDYDK